MTILKTGVVPENRGREKYIISDPSGVFYRRMNSLSAVIMYLDMQDMYIDIYEPRFHFYNGFIRYNVYRR